MNKADVVERIEALITDGYPDHPDDWERYMVELLEFVTGQPQELTCNVCGTRFSGMHPGDYCPKDRCSGAVYFQPPREP